MEEKEVCESLLNTISGIDLLKAGRAQQESISTCFASLPRHLLLVTVGDRILSQLNPWSESV